jgi:hypothetical protein
MSYWSWWLGGLGLAAVVLLHWFTLGRQMAVSGRFTALVNRLRFGLSDSEVEAASMEDQLAAMRAATMEAFGEDAVAESVSTADVPQPRTRKPRQQPMTIHVLFLACLVLGGALSAALPGATVAGVTMGVRSETFIDVFGSASWVAPLVLGLGGVLVGFGTRMSSGCTSGHGLCGVSRGSPAGLLATACFFGAGIVLSFVFRGLM